MAMGKRGPAAGFKRWWNPAKGKGQKKPEQFEEEVSAAQELQKEVSSARQFQKEVSSAEPFKKEVSAGEQLEKLVSSAEQLQEEVSVSRAVEEGGCSEAELFVAMGKRGPAKGTKRWWKPHLGPGQQKPFVTPKRKAGRGRPPNRPRGGDSRICKDYPF